MTKNIGGGRALRVCDLCGGVDDHPRHGIVGTIGGNGPIGTFPGPSEDVVSEVLASAPDDQRSRLLRDLYDPSTSDRHMDCCRDAGCPDGTCNQVTKGAEDKRGKALLEHLTKGQ